MSRRKTFVERKACVFSDKRRLLVDIGQTELEGNTALNIKLTTLNLVIPVIHGVSSCDISQGVMLNSRPRESLVVRLLVIQGRRRICRPSKALVVLNWYAVG